MEVLIHPRAPPVYFRSYGDDTRQPSTSTAAAILQPTFLQPAVLQPTLLQPALPTPSSNREDTVPINNTQTTQVSGLVSDSIQTETIEVTPSEISEPSNLQESAVPNGTSSPTADANNDLRDKQTKEPMEIEHTETFTSNIDDREFYSNFASTTQPNSEDELPSIVDESSDSDN